MSPAESPPQVVETEFEKRRGISRVEVRDGYAQVHVSNLAEPVAASRLAALAAVSEAGLSLDFLKLTPRGLSFLVREELAPNVSAALAPLKLEVEVQGGRGVLMVHAVNMRDEEGLIASILLSAIASGAGVCHVSDMHDRALLVVAAQDAPNLKARLEAALLGRRS